MRWSKLKQQVEARMAEPLRGRVQLHATAYTWDRDARGRGWITVDKREIANFCDFTQEMMANRRFPDERSPQDYYRALHELRADGVLSRSDFFIDLERFLSLSIDDALASSSPLIRALAMTDRRLGKRRLRALMADGHPLVRQLHALRCEIEGIRLEQSSAAYD